MKCPETLQEIEKLEKYALVCYAEMKAHADNKIKQGGAKTMTEACRQLGEENGLNGETIRNGIKRAAKKSGALPQNTEPAETVEENRQQWLKFRRAIRQSLKILESLNGLNDSRREGFRFALSGMETWSTKHHINGKGNGNGKKEQ